MKSTADTGWSSKAQQLQDGFVETFAYAGLGFGPRWQVTTSVGTPVAHNKILNATFVMLQIFSYLCGAFHTAVLLFGLTRSWSRNPWRTSSETLGVMEIGAHQQNPIFSSSRADMPGQLTRSRHDQTILPPKYHKLRTRGLRSRSPR